MKKVLTILSMLFLLASLGAVEADAEPLIRFLFGAHSLFLFWFCAKAAKKC